MIAPSRIDDNGEDFYVPAFEVMLGTRKMPQDVVLDVTQVSFKNSLTEIDSFEITLSNLWDHATSSFKYSDSELFDPPKKVTISMGYLGQTGLIPMITGEITGLRPTFPESGQSTLTVSGQHLLHRLTRRKQESDTYERMTDSQMARRIAGRLNMTLKIDETASGREVENAYVLQNNQYDIVFLLERARRLGYEVFVVESQDSRNRENELHFKPSDSVQRKSYILTYGETLISFTPTLTTANQVEKVTVQGWDRRRKQPITGQATRQELQTNGVGQKGRQNAINNAVQGYEEVITDKPVRDNAEAKQLARQTLENIAKDLVRGSGSTIGLPLLRAGTVVQLGGMGVRFSGRYFVTGTTHTIGDGGYTTQFECRREEKQ